MLLKCFLKGLGILLGLRHDWCDCDLPLLLLLLKLGRVETCLRRALSLSFLTGLRPTFIGCCIIDSADRL